MILRHRESERGIGQPDKEKQRSKEESMKEKSENVFERYKNDSQLENKYV